ncbi:MAG: hypothetical protein ATN31_00870 [Candidatus Epulonipiscioides saccharophilum]|nr:MAG: hypothetical protein ATN31_00870 [Epulopiscium sp. AS2M-Bin001]
MKIKKSFIIISSFIMSTVFIHAENYVDESFPDTSYMQTNEMTKSMHYPDEMSEIIDKIEVYEYDLNGNFIRKSSYVGPNENVVVETKKSKKDEVIELPPLSPLKNGLVDYRRDDQVENYDETERTTYEYQYLKDKIIITQTQRVLTNNGTLDILKTKTYEYDIKHSATNTDDQEPKLIKYEEAHYDGDTKTIVETKTYTYTNIGFNDGLIFTTEKRGTTESVTSKFNSKGNPIEKMYTINEMDSTENEQTNIKQIIKYNEYDHVTQISDYNSSGKLLQREIHEYDSKGNKMKITTTGNNPAFELFEYDSDNQLIKHSFYENSLLNSYYIYEYDLLGNQIKESYYNTKLLQYSKTTIYDVLGNLIRYEEYYGNAEDSRNYFEIYTYNDKNQRLSAYRFKYNQTSDGYTVYEYVGTEEDK